MGLSDDMPIQPLLEFYGFDGIKPDHGWHTVRCVFHGDRTASGRVSTRDNAYRCQACDAKGDTISLIVWRERVDVPGAIEFYERVTGSSVPRVSGKASGRGRSERPRLPQSGKAVFERGHQPFSPRVHGRRTEDGRPRT